MIDRSHELPVTRQAELLKLSRSSVYYEPVEVSPADLAIMRRMDALHLEHPFAGSRMLRDLLRRESVQIGRAHVITLMRKMRIEAIYRKPNTSKPSEGHKIYPYLLRELKVERPNQVWAMDITYIPMARGFVYLAAVVDWHTRRVLSWRVSITMEVDFCLEAVEGCKLGRRHVKTLMKRMGIEALYRRPRTTKPEPGHKIHPYLLRGMEITRRTMSGR